MNPSNDLLADFPVVDAPPKAPATPKPATSPSKDAAPTAPAAQPPIMAQLQEATQDLTYPSETDAPLKPFFWPDTEVTEPTPEIVATHTKRDASDFQTQSVARFFKNVVAEEEWHNEEEKADVRRFQALAETIKTSLKSAKVFRAGEVKIDVYLVGLIEGGYAGLQTQVVET